MFLQAQFPASTLQSTLLERWCPKNVRARLVKSRPHSRLGGGRHRSKAQAAWVCLGFGVHTSTPVNLAFLAPARLQLRPFISIAAMF